MESTKTKFVVRATLIMVGVLILNDQRVFADCKIQIPELVTQCGKFVTKEGPKIHPSQGCCGVLKSVDVPCICKFVTKEVENLISMEKVVYVARTCGLTVNPGTKCGSYTVPPLA